MIDHTVTLKKFKRIPLDPHFLPVCITCGPLLTAPTDADAAKVKKRRHEAASVSLAGADDAREVEAGK